MKREVSKLNIDGKILEYSMCGKGIPILMFHGGHSNCYEELGYSDLLRQGFSLITPSRPGYGVTSKEISESLLTASKFYAKLLDCLNIKKVHLLAVSAGGPSGISFAAHFPERTLSLTLQSAVTKEWLTKKDKEYKAAQILFNPSVEKVTWKFISYMNNCFPIFTFKRFIPSFSKLSPHDVMTKINKEDIEELCRMNNRYRSGCGFLIDILQATELSSNTLNSITCPTLIMHSKNDGAVSLEHAYFAKNEIEQSELCLLDSWGHLIWIGDISTETTEKVASFLLKNNPTLSLDKLD
ncbi:alpha/beta fold hydrolase [Priestia megaterium]|uniref:alpha/beta fold hydrolase n=1 Tax=Priestia megaterium TaxID=1404 RepID=UPI002364675D|nr:alpha/beta hydrolase [Priestia megaterium]MDD1515311.1 alpha/beta hydrolase [Priestia megaterium]